MRGGRKIHSLSASSSSYPVLPPNEFSRTIQPDRVLRKRGGGQRSPDYSVEIEASDMECQALAMRFDLSDIAKLKAMLLIRSADRDSSTSSASSTSIEVEGTVQATVTQRCVRTNENFQVDIEFPLYCIVRPVIPIATMLAMKEQQQSPTNNRKVDDTKGNNNKKRKGTNSKNRDSYRNSYYDTNIDDMDVMQIQRMLQQDINDDDDVLMEDEAIYAVDGLLDIGELVSQLFWLKLDPYPKKPGTGPIQKSITG